MSDQGSKRGKAHKGYDRLGMISILMIVLILLAVMLKQSRELSFTVASYQSREEELVRLLDQEEERTREIRQLRDYMQTDEYAEQTARERLGLVKDNEIVFEEVQ